MAPPADAQLTVGRTARYPLAGAGSVGYTWQWQVSGDADAVDVSVVPETTADHAAHAAPFGGSVGQILQLHALRPGVATVRLRLVRPPEPHRPPRQEHTVVVHVTG